MKLTIGNQSGPYFYPGVTEEVMKPIAEDFARKLPEVTDFHIYYDQPNDFHHLTFTYNGKKFDMRYYKVLSYHIDGNQGKWSGCPLYKRFEWVEYVTKELKA